MLFYSIQVYFFRVRYVAKQTSLSYLLSLFKHRIAIFYVFCIYQGLFVLIWLFEFKFFEIFSISDLQADFLISGGHGHGGHLVY